MVENLIKMVASWKATVKEMRELAEKDTSNATMWRAAASAWEQAANELDKTIYVEGERNE